MDLQRGQLHANGVLHAYRAVVVAIILSGSLAAPAAGQVSVEASPLRVEFAAAPGSSSTQAVTLTNAGSEAVRIRATLSDWTLSVDGAPQFEGADRDAFSATPWVRIAPPEQVIEPGGEGTVRFSLSVPADATAGGYRTGILFDFAAAAGDQPTRAHNVTFRSRIASLIYVNIGEPPAAVELTDLRVRSVGSETRVVALVRNTSRRNVRTRGHLVVSDPNGAAVRDVPVPDVPILPESEREVAIVAVDPASDRPLPPGNYRVELKLDVAQAALIVGETVLTIDR
jgi:P pilus assembly chaperone PapD